MPAKQYKEKTKQKSKENHKSTANPTSATEKESQRKQFKYIKRSDCCR
jgi:hypothetical protein